MNQASRSLMNRIRGYVAPLAITAVTAACQPMLTLDGSLLNSQDKPVKSVTYEWKGTIDDPNEQIVYDTFVKAMPELVAEMKKKNVSKSTIDSLVAGINKKDASDVGYALLAAEQDVSGTFEAMGKYKIAVSRYLTPEGAVLGILFVKGAVKFIGNDSGTGTTAAKKFGGGGTCLLNDSLVLVNKSDIKKVQDLEVGGEILAFDEKDGKIIKTKITKIIKNHPRGFFYCINGNLFITNDHPVLVFRNNIHKWCRVENLLIGDRIKSLSGFTEVKSIVKALKPAVTVYIETESGNYIVKGENDYYVVNANYMDKNIEGYAPEIEAPILF